MISSRHGKQIKLTTRCLESELQSCIFPSSLPPVAFLNHGLLHWQEKKHIQIVAVDFGKLVVEIGSLSSRLSNSGNWHSTRIVFARGWENELFAKISQFWAATQLNLQPSAVEFRKLRPTTVTKPVPEVLLVGLVPNAGHEQKTSSVSFFQGKIFDIWLLNGRIFFTTTISPHHLGHAQL
jgi:hypothetical protein